MTPRQTPAAKIVGSISVWPGEDLAKGPVSTHSPFPVFTAPQGCMTTNVPTASPLQRLQVWKMLSTALHSLRTQGTH